MKVKIVRGVHARSVQLEDLHRSSDRFVAGAIRQPITMKVGALGIEPSFGSFVIREQPLHDAPESGRMVHFNQMCHLMRGEIVEHMARRQNETP